MTVRTQRIVEAWAPVVVLPPLLVADAALDDTDIALTWWRVALVVVACLPLVPRRRLPFRWIAVPITGGVVLALSAVEPANTVVLIPAIALFELALRRDRRSTQWVAAAVLPCVVVGVAPFADGAAELVENVVRNWALCALALALGAVVRSRREAAEAQAERRVDDERLRIAREIHDTVAHAMVAINVQAGVAAHLIEKDPEHARSALREIKDASGAALADLRATLGMLRGDEQAPTAPAASLAGLSDLGAGLRSAGVDVRVEVDELPRLAPGVEAALYRIVQEALTNVLRHADASAVRVAVGAGDGGVDVEVVDDGVAHGGTAGAGQGLRGMRERAEALGGEVSAGPGPEGGWRVHAWVPA